MAVVRGQWSDVECYALPHATAEREHREESGECVSTVGKAKPHHEGGERDYLLNTI